jgi:hypothetical protein
MNPAPLSKLAFLFEKQSWRRLAAIVLALVATGSVQAQNGDATDVTNAALEAAAMILSNAVAQLPDFVSTNEFGSNDLSQAGQTSDSSDTNFVPPAGGGPSGPPESRRSWLQRQRAGRPGTNDGGQPGVSSRSSNNTTSEYRPAKPDFSAFKIITERNVFDPNRVPHRPGFQPKPKTVESFALVGVMTYEKGTFAFFDGTSSDYRKALKAADTIAGFKLTNIEDNAVKLILGTNQVDLRVGMQLRREEAGDWVPSSQTDAYAAPAASATASTQSPAGAGGGESDVLERLRKKREQE